MLVLIVGTIYSCWQSSHQVTPRQTTSTRTPIPGKKPIKEIWHFPLVFNQRRTRPICLGYSFLSDWKYGDEVPIVVGDYPAETSWTLCYPSPECGIGKVGSVDYWRGRGGEYYGRVVLAGIMTGVLSSFNYDNAKGGATVCLTREGEFLEHMYPLASRKYVREMLILPLPPKTAWGYADGIGLMDDGVLLANARFPSCILPGDPTPYPVPQ